MRGPVPHDGRELALLDPPGRCGRQDLAPQLGMREGGVDQRSVAQKVSERTRGRARLHTQTRMLTHAPFALTFAVHRSHTSVTALMVSSGSGSSERMRSRLEWMMEACLAHDPGKRCFRAERSSDRWPVRGTCRERGEGEVGRAVRRAGIMTTSFQAPLRPFPARKLCLSEASSLGQEQGRIPPGPT